MTERKTLTLKSKKLPTTANTDNTPLVEPVPVQAVATATAILEKIETQPKAKSKSKPKKKENLDAVFDYIRQLATAYPQTFFIEGKQRKPLMIGITEKITQAMPQLDKQQLRKTLMMYCGSYGYLKATLTETHRIDLDGQAVAEISAEDKTSAELRLANREKHNKTTIDPASKPIKNEPAVNAKNNNKETTMSHTPAAGVAAQATARAAKITLVLDNNSLTRVDSTGQKQTQLIVQVSEMTFTTELSSKSYRKALATLDELGADNCVMILQGSMPTFGKLEGAGLVVQAKKAKD